MSTFQFKHFSVSQSNATMKVGMDAMLLGSLVSLADEPSTVLDIGTGTGVLALMIAQRSENALVMALEIDELACREAEENFKASAWSNRLASIHEDVLEIEFDAKFDLIISNPPYYENSLLSEDVRTSRAKHAEFLPIDSLLNKVNELLANEGAFWVIIPSENSSTWIAAAKVHDLFPIHVVSIIGKEGQGEKRSVLAFGRKPSETISTELTVRDTQNNYSKAYIELTKEFHDRDLSK
ncbi:MAG: methyltransferase [Crocinitomicaceae bacterium]|nr:methyltransferase [Crocinitomicaceae bacterium]